MRPQAPAVIDQDAAPKQLGLWLAPADSLDRGQLCGIQADGASVGDGAAQLGGAV